MTKIGQHIREKFAAFVPEGYSIDDLRIATSLAQVQSVDELDSAQRIALTVVQQDQKEAGPPLINSLGKPTILKIVSWIGHAGVTNRNRDAFVREELEQIAGSLFRAPNFGVMDFNHSAVRIFSDDPKIIGIWYKAEWAFDTKANDGKGAWGILATGIAFSWLFPEIADKLLADQARTGTIKVSWTWIPGSIEMAQDDRGSYAINHNPVFFTVAVLDVPPADPDAAGRGSEDPAVLDEDLKSQVAVAERITKYAMTVSQAGSATSGTAAGFNGWWVPIGTASAGNGGTNMNDEMIKRLQAEKSEAELKLVEITTKYSAKEAEADAKIVALTAARDAAVAAHDKTKTESETRIAELTTARDSAVTELAKVKDELETRVSDLTTAREHIVGEMEKVITRAQALEEEVKSLRAQVTEIESAKAEVQKKTAENAKKARLAARIAQLPESFRKLHAAKADEVRERIEAKWSEMTDEQWEQYKNDELLGYQTTKVGFVLRSAAEGVLPKSGTEDEDDIKNRVQRLLKH